MKLGANIGFLIPSRPHAKDGTTLTGHSAPSQRTRHLEGVYSGSSKQRIAGPSEGQTGHTIRRAARRGHARHAQVPAPSPAGRDAGRRQLATASLI